MTLEEVGAYFSLLSNAWLSERHGYLEDDDERLRRLSRMAPKQWQRSREVLLRKFPVVEAGWRANPRMVVEAEKQVRFNGGQAVKARKRWDKDARARAAASAGNAGECLPFLLLFPKKKNHYRRLRRR
jgi:uncharacterized protein YdaU (DUF1376 family)